MSPLRAGEGSLPVRHGGAWHGGANIPNSTGLHRGRQIHRLHSKARGCRIAEIRKGRKGRKGRIVRFWRREPLGSRGRDEVKTQNRWVAGGFFCTAQHENRQPLLLSREICFKSWCASSYTQAHKPTATVYLLALLIRNDSVISWVLLGSTPAHWADFYAGIQFILPLSICSFKPMICLLLQYYTKEPGNIFIVFRFSS